jgi:hypothetical protein
MKSNRRVFYEVATGIILAVVFMFCFDFVFGAK